MTLRVHVVTQDDPFYLPEFFRTFLSSVPETVEIDAISVLRPFDESFSDLVKRMYRLYGPKNFVRRGMSFVYRKGADAVGLKEYSVESVAQRHGISTERRSSVNSEMFIRRIKSEDIDVVLSVASPEIFDPELLDAPRWGCINIHTAKLPKYRGMLPTFWALYHDEDEIGVTVHTMAEAIDQGEIVRQTTFPIESGDSLGDVIVRGKRLGGETAAKALEDIESGSVSLSPMAGEESYFSFPTIEDRREFQRRGNELL